ncbi:MAG TPA: LysM peptidoglycan-binding domain-containing protein [Phycisphaerae bacterium]|nr:LysM peptidoglycan-binding domain-containing protein [Phycisphaerae bacterium]HOI55176.1 LysM peptidoglycan-binding domain-containing protein [Phycisphaerae bacterium]
MKRLLAIVAIVLVASAIVGVVVYFATGLWGHGGADSSSTVAEQPSSRTLPAVVRTPDTSSPSVGPRVDGLVLRPHEPRGQEISPPSQRDAAARGGYEVQPGDSLYKIALAHYGDASYVSDIRNANPGLTDTIRPGQRIRLPARHQERPLAQQQTVTPQVYTVRRGDTLIAIARRHYGDSAVYMDIFNLNRHQLSSPEALREGMVLKMPPRPQFDE